MARSPDLEAALSGSTAMREPQKREAFRLPFFPRPALPCGVWSELDQPRLLRMQFQPELRQPFPKLLQEPFGLVAVLEPHHQVSRPGELSSYGSRHGATPLANLPVRPQLRIASRDTRDPMCRAAQL